jgi:hypothetical protein
MFIGTSFQIRFKLLMVLMNYMTKMFRGIQIDVPQPKLMTCIWEYISNCTCHDCVLINENWAWMLASIVVKKVSKRQINEGIASLNNNPAPKIIIYLWWLVPRSGTNDISNLFV